MKCLKCEKEFDEELDSCPFCGASIENEEMEMPQLKKEDIVEEDIKQDDNSNEEVQVENDELDKTVSISSLSDTKELKDLSLIDDINKQIDSVNALKEAEEVKEEINDLSTSDSIKKRRKVLFITGIVSLILSLIIIGFLVFKNSSKEATIVKDYLQEYEVALEKYYESNEIDDVIFILESIKDDADKVKKVQSKTRIIFDSWILLYIDEEANTLDEYDKITDRYKELLNGLHTYAVAKTDENYITALTDYDYEELKVQIDDIYSDCIVFFEALAYYNEKDYDRAYYMFDVIDDSNSYYERAQSYKKRIINNVVDLLNKDVDKITAGIDGLSDEDKLQRYVNVEEVIISYNSIYNNLNLSSNDDYQSLLNLYTSKVSEYTDIVSNSNQDIDKEENESNDETSNNGSSEEVEPDKEEETQINESESTTQEESLNE